MPATNNFTAVGEVITEPCFSHCANNGEEFYFFFMFTKRHSGVLDRFKCYVRRELTAEIEVGKEIEIYGEVRTRNYYENDVRHVMVYVLVKEVYTARTEAIATNSVSLDGFIAKPPIVRDTPMGRRICDVILAVNHSGRSSYIPCIIWGNSADLVGKKTVGDRLIVRGRLQSREYWKEEDLKIAYEVSVSEFYEN